MGNSVQTGSFIVFPVFLNQSMEIFLTKEDMQNQKVPPEKIASTGVQQLEKPAKLVVSLVKPPSFSVFPVFVSQLKEFFNSIAEELRLKQTKY